MVLSGNCERQVGNALRITLRHVGCSRQKHGWIGFVSETNRSAGYG